MKLVMEVSADEFDHIAAEPVIEGWLEGLVIRQEGGLLEADRRVISIAPTYARWEGDVRPGISVRVYCAEEPKEAA